MEEKFSARLLEWFAQNPRPLPWKNTKNPYFIWLSEIILQQTRVEQGTPYYLKFIERFPSIQQLAEAEEDVVLKLWEGLGYYSRARNLHTAAKYIYYELGGVFPRQYKDILSLKGVGTYTAAAIASFAYDLPYAVVDGNVYRVLSRYFGISTPIDTTEGKKLFAEKAQSLLDRKRPAAYNQAIMNFGAMQCLPKPSKCPVCPFQIDCVAYGENRVSDYPVKQKKLKKRLRFFHYLIFNSKQYVYLERRERKDIWQGLYQFPMIEGTALIEDWIQLLKTTDLIKNTSDLSLKKTSKPYKQSLTHQHIIANFWEINCSKKISFLENNYVSIKRSNLDNYAFPKIIDRYLNDKHLYLF